MTQCNALATTLENLKNCTLADDQLLIETHRMTALLLSTHVSRGNIYGACTADQFEVV